MIAQVNDIERLPTQWCGYEGVDAVILSTSRPEDVSQVAANNARVQALDQWVRMGGRLVLCVGSQGEEDPRRKLAAAAIRAGPVRKGGSLASDRSDRDVLRKPRVDRPGDRRQSEMHVSRLADVQGVVEADERGMPLVIRTARGFGQVIFVAVDLDQPPLDKWSDRPLLVARLLDMPTGHADESQGKRGHDALRLRRSCRPVAQRLGPIHAASGWCRFGLWRA